MGSMADAFKKADTTGKYKSEYQNYPKRDNAKPATAGGYGAKANDFPDGYLSNGYKADNGDMDRNYILKYAKVIGGIFTFDINARPSRLGYNKVRIFFEEVCRISDSLKFDSISSGEAQMKLDQLIARVYKRNSMGTVSTKFRDFITKNIEYIDSLTDDADIKEAITHFKYHYEAVIGFTDAGK